MWRLVSLLSFDSMELLAVDVVNSAAVVIVVAANGIGEMLFASSVFDAPPFELLLFILLLNEIILSMSIIFMALFSVVLSIARF